MSDMYYRENPEWKDITPIPQDDGPNPLVPIAFADEYTDAMDYFRAVSRTNEKSERVLTLIKDIIDMNPAHYTVWDYRQKVLFELNSNLDQELDYIDEIGPEQAKNYQVWHHRQVIVDKLDKGDRELPYINSIIKEDSKNYHGWSYRQWVVKRFSLWDEEMKYTAKVLELDIKNNSAWNHRFFILVNKPTTPTEQEIESEIKFVKDQIIATPDNSSSWSYLKGLYRKTNKPLDTLEPFVKELVGTNIDSPFPYSFYIDIYQEKAKHDNSAIDPAALQMCTELAEKYDTTREKYWIHKKQSLEKTIR